MTTASIKQPASCQSGLPLVSIVIPVYNGSNFLQAAIESALAQTYTNNEILIVNDGSTDGGETERISLSYGDRVRYFSKINGGVASALNMGIGAMSGSYFSWLSHDDVYYPEKVAEQVACLERIGRDVVLYSDYDVIDSQSRVLRRMTIKSYQPDEFCRALIVDNPIQGCSALVPREFFAAVGPFNEKLLTTQDYDMWFRLAPRYDFVHMPLALLQSREHIDQGTITMTTIHVPECNDFLVDGLSKVLDDRQKSVSDKEERRFLAECISSFQARGFHKAAHVALALYVKSLFGKNWLREPESLRPVWNYLLANLRRIARVLTRT